MKLNFHVILNFLGALIFFIGLFMLSCLPIAFIYQDGGIMEFTIPGISALLIGALLWFLTKDNSKKLKKRDGYIIVTFGWLVISILGAMPYLILGGDFDSFGAAWFESVSGFTTTGASVLNDIEAQPKAILFWRSITHWLGGMGIIVLTLAILPLLGIGGMQLFVAEAPGPTADKLHPRITETAKRLWIIYVGMTIVETFLLLLCGMSLFDAVNHAFATVSTGGFSTKNSSLAELSAPVHYVVILFMFLSGINFSLIYFGLKGKLHKIWKNEEFKYYVGLIIFVTLFTSIIVFINNPLNIQEFGYERAFRDALFQTLAVITTTGFVTADFTAWGPFLKIIFFLLMFVGASAGSTSGGVKIVRHIVILKNGLLEFKRQLHPKAIIPVRLNGRAVKPSIALNILAFFLIYMSIFSISCAVMGAMGHDFETVLGSVATSLGNVGPGLGKVNPVSNFAFFPEFEKIFLSFLMLLGRLELFTVLILFTPFFWRNH